MSAVASLAFVSLTSLASALDPASVIPEIAVWSTGVVDVALREAPPPGTIDVLSMPEDFSRKTAAALVIAQLRNGRFVQLEPFGDVSPTKPVLVCVETENDAVHARVLLARGTAGAIVDTLVTPSPLTKRLVFARAAVVANVANVENERTTLTDSRGDGVCKALDRAVDGRVVVAGNPVKVPPRETRARGVAALGSEKAEKAPGAAARADALFEASVRALPDLVATEWPVLEALADAQDLRAHFAARAAAEGADPQESNLELLVASAFGAQVGHVVPEERPPEAAAMTRAFVRSTAGVVEITFTDDSTDTSKARTLSWLPRSNGAVLLAAASEPNLIDEQPADIVFTKSPDGALKRVTKWTRATPVEPPTTPAPTTPAPTKAPAPTTPAPTPAPGAP